MDTQLQDALIKVAIENKDEMLMRVVIGRTSPSYYLEKAMENNFVGFANVPQTSTKKLSTIIKANTRRRNQLLKWIEQEKAELKKGSGGNEKYIEVYERELAALEDYFALALIDIITDGEALNELGFEDEADRIVTKEERKAAKAEKEAEKTNA